MTSYLEVRGPSGVELVPLAGDRVTIGRGSGNTIRLERDRLVSQLHAVIESIGGNWYVRDLGSRNGTHLGGDRILGDRVLRHGEELLLGQTRATFRSAGPSDVPPTEGAAPPPEPPPELPRRERDVLRALCRPLFGGQMFAEPASMRQIAAELVVTEAAVQQLTGFRRPGHR
ncbi:MAG: FHA domain-containing protein [Pseudonocardiaceae bacterium]